MYRNVNSNLYLREVLELDCTLNKTFMTFTTKHFINNTKINNYN